MAEDRHHVVRWNPFGHFHPLEAFSPLRELAGMPRLSRMMDDVFGEGHGGAILRFALDVTESEKAYAVSAELPGVRKEDLTVECKDGVLSIRGEKRSEREEAKERGRILERTYGAFGRSIRLPEDADTDQIAASFQDGVLRLEIQKRPEAKARTIAVKS